MILLAFLRMCIFFCTFEHLPWLAHLFSPIIQGQFPRSYSHPMQPILQFARNMCKKKCLHINHSPSQYSTFKQSLSEY